MGKTTEGSLFHLNLLSHHLYLETPADIQILILKQLTSLISLINRDLFPSISSLLITHYCFDNSSQNFRKFSETLENFYSFFEYHIKNDDI